MIYNPSNKKYSDNFQKVVDNPFKIFSVNHSKEIYYNPLEDVDLEEKKAILYDIFNSMPVQGDFKVKKAKFERSRGFFGGDITSKIFGYNCQKFRIDLQLEYTLNKKSQELFKKSKGEYLKIYNKETLQSSEHENMAQSTLLDTPKEKIEVKFNKNMYSFTTKKKQLKSQAINIHLTKDHSFSLKDIIPIIKILASGNNLMKKLEEVLNKDVVEEISQEGFPIKIQVPMNMSIRGNVFIKKFERICPENDNKISEIFFEIPDEYKFESRKVAQKILSRNKKRMLLANMIL